MKINEKTLKRIINESVRKVIKEGFQDGGSYDFRKACDGCSNAENLVDQAIEAFQSIKGWDGGETDEWQGKVLQALNVAKEAINEYDFSCVTELSEHV